MYVGDLDWWYVENASLDHPAPTPGTAQEGAAADLGRELVLPTMETLPPTERAAWRRGAGTSQELARAWLTGGWLAGRVRRRAALVGHPAVRGAMPT